MVIYAFKTLARIEIKHLSAGFDIFISDLHAKTPKNKKKTWSAWTRGICNAEPSSHDSHVFLARKRWETVRTKVNS
jgi:hypothetical protein